MLVIAASAIVCHASSLHFAGVLEAHFYGPAPMRLFFAEGISAWLSMALVLHFLGVLLAPGPYRLIDMLGTQALARWPYFFVALVSLPGGVRRATDHFFEKAAGQQNVTQISAGDAVLGVIAVLVAVVAAIWMVMLMY
ncbi:MAG TPA: hypothetical protein VLH60_07765, partial [Sedimentisphaerales bacterium]|nr:hypothetical protein [Sedimentisphaerales bacterium]